MACAAMNLDFGPAAGAAGKSGPAVPPQPTIIQQESI